MKINNYKYIIGAALALLSSCGDDIDPVYTVGEADNAIVLNAGAYEGGSKVMTRAVDDNHSKHLALANGIKMRLQVSGTWAGHKDTSDQDASNVVKETTATVGAETGSGTKHNSVTFSTTSTPAEMLYWDDFGTADPANKETGRTTGLTIYGVAVNDASISSAPEVQNWESLEWTLDDNQSTTANDWTKKDLIISNNNQTGSGFDGPLKFDTWKTSGGLLEYKHAMSKITINLKANKGFPTSGTNLVGNTTNKFESNPSVELLTRNSENEEIAYAVTKGTVNVKTGAVTASTVNDDQKKITMKLDHVHEAWATGATDFKYTVQMTALVVPGTVLGATHTDGNSTTPSTAEKKTIAKITVDDNVYYVNAQKISEAMGSVFTTEPGKNYILNINVDKTEVHVSATIADWMDVTAAEATPKINITTSYGADGTPFPKESLSFYYSKAKDAPATDKYGISTSTYYAADATGTVSGGNITLEPAIYWPTHNTKYFFRGVWPTTKTDGTTPSVTLNDNHQGISVQNSKYEENTSPSDLMIGIPLKKNADGSLQKDANGKYIHDENDGTGISATEGTITLNFTYRMAQVIVQLKSSGWDDTKDPKVLKDNNVDFGSAGTGGANQAKVEIVNGYDQGYILLADGSASLTHKGDYVMTPLSTTLPSEVPDFADDTFSYATDANKFLVRHDAVIPQSLGTTETDALKFKITTGSLTDESKQDIYYISIKDILAQENGGSTKSITAWEAGKKYTYTLNITKTEVKIKATITPWIDVVAGGDFWL